MNGARRNYHSGENGEYATAGRKKRWGLVRTGESDSSLYKKNSKQNREQTGEEGKFGVWEVVGREGGGGRTRKKRNFEGKNGLISF